MSGWEYFWQFFWGILYVFALFGYLIALWYIITDIFRDHKLNGWFKALWILGLFLVPLLSPLVYLIACGKGMGERQMAVARAQQAATDDYIRQAAAKPTNAAEQIATAKNLLDTGVITQAEFDKIKAGALAG